MQSRGVFVSSTSFPCRALGVAGRGGDQDHSILQKMIPVPQFVKIEVMRMRGVIGEGNSCVRVWWWCAFVQRTGLVIAYSVRGRKKGNRLSKSSVCPGSILGCNPRFLRSAPQQSNLSPWLVLKERIIFSVLLVPPPSGKNTHPCGGSGGTKRRS